MTPASRGNGKERCWRLSRGNRVCNWGKRRFGLRRVGPVKPCRGAPFLAAEQRLEVLPQVAHLGVDLELRELLTRLLEVLATHRPATILVVSVDQRVELGHHRAHRQIEGQRLIRHHLAVAQLRRHPRAEAGRRLGLEGVDRATQGPRRLDPVRDPLRVLHRPFPQSRFAADVDMGFAAGHGTSGNRVSGIGYRVSGIGYRVSEPPTLDRGY